MKLISHIMWNLTIMEHSCKTRWCGLISTAKLCSPFLLRDVEQDVTFFISKCAPSPTLPCIFKSSFDSVWPFALRNKHRERGRHACWPWTMPFSITKSRGWPNFLCVWDLCPSTFAFRQQLHSVSQLAVPAWRKVQRNLCRWAYINEGQVFFPFRTSRGVLTGLPWVPVQTRIHVVRISFNGASQMQIAKAFGITEATVNRIVNVFRDEGCVSDLGRNCTRQTTQEVDTAMVEVFC